MRIGSWNLDGMFSELSENVEITSRVIAHLNERLPYTFSIDHSNRSSFEINYDTSAVAISASYRSIMDRIRSNNYKLDTDVDELLEILCKGDRDRIFEIIISSDILNCISCYNVELTIGGSIEGSYYGHNLYVDESKTRYIKLIDKLNGEEYILNLDGINENKYLEEVDISEDEFDTLLVRGDISST